VFNIIYIKYINYFLNNYYNVYTLYNNNCDNNIIYIKLYLNTIKFNKIYNVVIYNIYIIIYFNINTSA
jgi:hypothetical protein